MNSYIGNIYGSASFFNMQSKKRIDELLSEVATGKKSSRSLDETGWYKNAIQSRISMGKLDSEQQRLSYLESASQITTTALENLKENVLSFGEAVNQFISFESSADMVVLEAKKFLEDISSSTSVKIGNIFLLSGEDNRSRPLINYSDESGLNARAAFLEDIQNYFGKQKDEIRFDEISKDDLIEFSNYLDSHSFHQDSWADNWFQTKSNGYRSELHEGSSVEFLSARYLSDIRDATKLSVIMSEIGDAISSDALRGLLNEEAASATSKAEASIISLISRYGASESRIRDQIQFSERYSQEIALQISKNESADLYSSITELSQWQVSLEASYSITARLSDLNLAKFL